MDHHYVLNYGAEEIKPILTDIHLYYINNSTK